MIDFGVKFGEVVMWKLRVEGIFSKMEWLVVLNIIEFWKWVFRDIYLI